MRYMLPYHGAGVLFWHIDRWGSISILLGCRYHDQIASRWSFPEVEWEEGDLRNPETGVREYRRTALRAAAETLLSSVVLDRPDLPLWQQHLPGLHRELFTSRLKTKRLCSSIDPSCELRWFSEQRIPKDTALFVGAQLRQFFLWIDGLRQISEEPASDHAGRYAQAVAACDRRDTSDLLRAR